MSDQTKTKSITLDEFIDEQRKAGCLKRKFSRVFDVFLDYCDKEGTEITEWDTCLCCRGVEPGEVVFDDE